VSERDELAAIVNEADWACRSQTIAEAILADGYRKPRTITTVEELEALPDNTVIRDSEPATLQLVDGQWFVPGHDQPWYVESIDLPVTVLHEPS
jgi:hypothetical protein